MQLVKIFLLCLLVTLSYGEEGNCDRAGHLLYENLGCKPIMKEGHDCPIKYECNLNVQNNTCIFGGKTIPLFEKLNDEEIGSACYSDCFCQSTNHIECADLECLEWSGDHPHKEGCYRTFEVGKCCAVGQLCPTKSKPPAECRISGYLQIEGERYFPGDTCLECVCHNKYDGKNEAPFCRRRICTSQITNSKEINKFCAPHYGGTDDRVLCCPEGWVCPSDKDIILPPNTDADKTSELTCQFGDKTLKFGERIQGEFNWYRDIIKKSNCECILPPLLTCRDVPIQTLTNSSTTTEKN